VSRKGNARVVIDSICEERWRKSITERNAFSPASSPHSAGLRGRVVVSYERATCSCRFTFDGYGERPGISWRSILTRPDKASRRVGRRCSGLPARLDSSIPPDELVVVVVVAISNAVAPYDIANAIPTWSTSVPPSVSGVMTIYKFPALAIIP